MSPAQSISRVTVCLSVCLSLVALPTFVVSAAAPPPAKAQSDTAIATLSFTGDFVPSDQQRLHVRLFDALERVGLDVVPPCETQTCTDPPHAWSIEVHISHEGPDYRTRISATPPDATTPVTEEAVCEICGLQELAESLEGLAVRVRSKADHLADPTTLTIQSTPSGAQVELDGEIRGTTPVTVGAAPGSHMLRITKPGYRPQVQTATLTAGTDQTFSYRLARASFIPGWLPWSLLGVGVGTLGSGIALLALHERPIRNDCNADALGNCQYLHDTLGGGIALTVTGLAATATGITLAAVRYKQLQLAPAVSPERVSLVVRGRF